MGIEQVMQMLKEKNDVGLVKFISDKGPNSCEDCLQHHGEIFRLDDQSKPKLPIHPNCRCKYVLLSNEEQEKMKKIKTQLINYGNQIAIQATQLLAECEKEIKSYAISHSATALPTAYQATRGIKKVKVIEDKVASTVENVKLKFMLSTLQASFWTMKKMSQVGYLLQEKMEKSGIKTTISEFKGWLSPMRKIEDSLKKWHYNRLNNPMQQPWALPQSPEEAIKRGFERAPDSQNLYHRNKGQKDNVKFHSRKTGQEIIFNGQGEIVTDAENIGTYNYFPASSKIDNLEDIVNSLLHFAIDVIPYYKWGNSKNDTTLVGSRILGPENGSVLDMCLMVLKIIREFEKINFKSGK